MLLLVFIVLVQMADAAPNRFVNLQFNQWCMDYKNKDSLAFCNEHCDKGVNAKGNCELVLPFEFGSMSEIQQNYACDYYSPFDVIGVAKDSKTDHLVCTYETTTYCKNNVDKQIGNRCYQMNVAANYTEAKCPNGYQMITGKLQKENRWATILLPLVVNSIWINGTGSKNNSMIIKNDEFNGVEHGMLGRIEESEYRQAVCYTGAIRIPIEQQMDSGKLEFFVTDNVVQPGGTPEKPNVNKYHEYCNNVFPGSIAAYPDHVKLYQRELRRKENRITNKIVHVAGQLKPNSGFVAVYDCSKSLKYEVVRPKYDTIDSAGRQMGIKDENFGSSKYPNNKCSDTVRSVLTIHNNGERRSGLNGLVDEPAIARHPLLCVRGSDLTPVSAASFCGERSEADSGPYDCKCKQGYRDAAELTAEEFANKHLYQKGQLCFPSSCKDSQLTLHVIMLIDLSGSEVGDSEIQARQYFSAMPDLIPKNAVISLIPWADHFDYHEYSANSEADMIRLKQEIATVKAVWGWQNSAATEALQRALQAFKHHNKQVKIMILVTDGDSDKRDAEYIKAGQEVIAFGVHTVVVHHGADYADIYINTLKAMVNPSEIHTNYLRVYPGQTPVTKNQFDLVFSTKCTVDIN